MDTSLADRKSKRYWTNFRRFIDTSRLGVLGIIFGLPLLCYMFAFFCNDVSGCPAPSLLRPLQMNWRQLADEIGWQGLSGLINWQSAVAVAGYHLLSLTLNAVLPSQEVEGTELQSGGRLKYKFNGGSCL